MKKKEIKLYSRWEKGMSSPEYYVYQKINGIKERIILREAIYGEIPFIKFKPDNV